MTYVLTWVSSKYGEQIAIRTLIWRTLYDARLDKWSWGAMRCNDWVVEIVRRRWTPSSICVRLELIKCCEVNTNRSFTVWVNNLLTVTTVVKLCFCLILLRRLKDELEWIGYYAWAVRGAGLLQTLLFNVDLVFELGMCRPGSLPPLYRTEASNLRCGLKQ